MSKAPSYHKEITKKTHNTMDSKDEETNGTLYQRNVMYT